MNRIVVIHFLVEGQPSWIQPMSSQTAWGYTYPRNQPTMVNQNYQPIISGNVYPGIPYPINMNIPWGKPNWMNVLAHERPLINTFGGHGGPPWGP